MFFLEAWYSTGLVINVTAAVTSRQMTGHLLDITLILTNKVQYMSLM